MDFHILMWSGIYKTCWYVFSCSSQPSTPPITIEILEDPQGMIHGAVLVESVGRTWPPPNTSMRPSTLAPCPCGRRHSLHSHMESNSSGRLCVDTSEYKGNGFFPWTNWFTFSLSIAGHLTYVVKESFTQFNTVIFTFVGLKKKQTNEPYND